MNSLDDYFTDNADSWIQSLPRYQQVRLNSLLNTGITLEEAADKWLSANVENTYPFGAEKKDNVFVDRIRDEMRLFLCGSEEYESVRSKIKSNGNIVHTYFVGVLSAAIATQLGFAAAFLAPVIALILASISQIGLNAWCKMKEQTVDQESRD